MTKKQELILSDELYVKLSKRGGFQSKELGRNYTAEEKIEVCQYWMSGLASRAIEPYVNIPAATIRYWMQQPWWKELLKELRKAKNEELDNKLSRIIDKSADALIDRIENGNFKVNPRTGDLERIPLTSSELSKDGLGIPFDKRALTRGDATSRVVKEEASPEKLLEQLAEQFVRITKLNEPKLIEGEVVKD